MKTMHPLRTKPYIDLPTPEQYFNPSVRFLIHGDEGDDPASFLYFLFGKKERLDANQLRELVDNPMLQDTFAQKEYMHGKQKTIRQMILDGDFRTTAGRSTRSNIFWIKENPEERRHPYRYCVKTKGKPGVDHVLERPDVYPKHVRYTAEALRPERSEVLNFEDFKRITNYSKDARLEALDPNPHSSRYMRSRLGIAGTEVSHPVIRGGISPEVFVLVEFDNRRLIIGEMGLSTQVIRSRKLLVKSATRRAFAFECGKQNAFSAPEETKEAIMQATTSTNEEDDEEEEDEERIAANSNAS